MKKSKAVPLSLPADADDVAVSADPRDTAGGVVRALVPERWLLRRLLAAVGDPPVRITLWDGSEVSAGATGPTMHMMIRDRRAFYRLLTNPQLRFGDAYAADRIEVAGDLVAFLEAVYRALDHSPTTGWLRDHVSRWMNRPRRNSLTGSRSNIHHHYDISNDFYRIWLDPDYMQYTCAYFPSPTLSIEQAQVAKMEHVCRKLRLRPGETVVEAGCGWGGLARYMAKHYGVKVRSYSISHQQIVYARGCVRAEGLDGQVEYIEDDYRNIAGEYDAFVSIGMLEHVGHANYPTLGRVIDRSLKEHGRGLIHSIGRNRAGLMNAWIERRIFPGAYPATLREMMDIFEPAGFSVLDVENLRLHYARTLQHWLARFDQASDRIEKMFDRAFVRAWRLYLAGSIAAFTTSSLQLFQIVFTRGANNEVPWTRMHLYQDTPTPGARR